MLAILIPNSIAHLFVSTSPVLRRSAWTKVASLLSVLVMGFGKRSMNSSELNNLICSTHLMPLLKSASSIVVDHGSPFFLKNDSRSRLVALTSLFGCSFYIMVRITYCN